jgi:hypothetical protein
MKEDTGLGKDDTDEFGGFDADFGSDESATPPSEGADGGSEETEDDQNKGEESDSAEGAELGLVPVGAKDKASSGKDLPLPRKQAKKPLTRRQKAVRLMLRRAGLDALPDLKVIMRAKEGEEVAIRDIALFIGTPEDEILAEIAAALPCKNIVNLSAEVEKNRVVMNGVEILRAGR